MGYYDNLSIAILHADCSAFFLILCLSCDNNITICLLGLSSSNCLTLSKGLLLLENISIFKILLSDGSNSCAFTFIPNKLPYDILRFHPIQKLLYILV